ncbi:hypothetical protein ACTFIZ_006430 [Dictyostelium cf. discoideum]
MHGSSDVTNLLDVNFLIYENKETNQSISPLTTNNVPSDISIVNSSSNNSNNEINSENIVPVQINNNNNNNNNGDDDDAVNSINIIPVQVEKEDKAIQIKTTTKSGQFILDASFKVTDNQEVEENKDVIDRDSQQNRVLVGEGHFGKVYESDFELDGRSSVVKKLKRPEECTKEAKTLIDVFDSNKMVTTECFKYGFSSIIMENMVRIGYLTLKQLFMMSDEQFSALGSPFTCRSEMIEPIINAMVIALHSVNYEKNYSHFDLNPGNIFVNVYTLKTCQSIGGGGDKSNTRNPVVLCDFGCAKKMDTQIRLCDTNGHENYKSLQRYWDHDQHKFKTISCIQDNNEDIFSLGVLIFEMLLKFVHPDTKLFQQNVLFLLKLHGIQIVSTDAPNNCTILKVAFSNNIQNFKSNTQFEEITFDSKFNSIISQIIVYIQYYRTRPNANQILESLINNHQYSLNNSLPSIYIENPNDKYELVDINSSNESSVHYPYDDDIPSFEITITHNNFN